MHSRITTPWSLRLPRWLGLTIGVVIGLGVTLPMRELASQYVNAVVTPMTDNAVHAIELCAARTR